MIIKKGIKSLACFPKMDGGFIYPHHFPMSRETFSQAWSYHWLGWGKFWIYLLYLMILALKVGLVNGLSWIGSGWAFIKKLLACELAGQMMTPNSKNIDPHSFVYLYSAFKFHMYKFLLYVYSLFKSRFIFDDFIQ